MGNKIQSRTTIDNLHIEAHHRYAKDQKELDPRLIADASTVSPHAELAGTSAIYSSQLEQLVESLIGTLPWASFQAPYGYLMQTNRFFRSALFAQKNKTKQQNDEEQEGNSDQEDEEKEHPLVELLKKKFVTHTLERQIPQAERDKDTLLTLAEEIGRIDALLAYITARKLQYQKG